MTDIPIIMSAPMVRALLDGRKTMTRRLAWKGTKPEPRFPEGTMRATPWQHVKPSDRLWVRESLRRGATSNAWCYSANDKLISLNWPDHRVAQMVGWAHHQERDSVPSIHMPRWASRLTLIVTAVKIERLQEIANPDAIAEGCGVDIYHPHPEVTREPFPVEAFRNLWTSLHGPGSWDTNPEVVALSFNVVKANIDSPEARAA